MSCTPLGRTTTMMGFLLLLFFYEVAHSNSNSWDVGATVYFLSPFLLTVIIINDLLNNYLHGTLDKWRTVTLGLKIWIGTTAF